MVSHGYVRSLACGFTAMCVCHPVRGSQIYICNLAQINPKHLPLAHGASLVRSYLTPAHSMRITYDILQARLNVYRA